MSLYFDTYHNSFNTVNQYLPLTEFVNTLFNKFIVYGARPANPSFNPASSQQCYVRKISKLVPDNNSEGTNRSLNLNDIINEVYTYTNPYKCVHVFKEPSIEPEPLKTTSVDVIVSDYISKVVVTYTDANGKSQTVTLTETTTLTVAVSTEVTGNWTIKSTSNYYFDIECTSKTSSNSTTSGPSSMIKTTLQAPPVYETGTFARFEIIVDTNYIDNVVVTYTDASSNNKTETFTSSAYIYAKVDTTVSGNWTIKSDNYIYYNSTYTKKTAYNSKTVPTSVTTIGTLKSPSVYKQIGPISIYNITSNNNELITSFEVTYINEYNKEVTETCTKNNATIYVAINTTAEIEWKITDQTSIIYFDESYTKKTATKSYKVTSSAGSGVMPPDIYAKTGKIKVTNDTDIASVSVTYINNKNKEVTETQTASSTTYNVAQGSTLSATWTIKSGNKHYFDEDYTLKTKTDSATAPKSTIIVNQLIMPLTYEKN